MTMQYKRFPLGSLWTNGYLFWDDEGRAFFVDPGGDVGEVVDFVKKRELTLLAVLLTHGHLDHLSGVEGLVPSVRDEIYIAAEDAELLRHPPEELKTALRMECGGVENFKTVADGDTLSVGTMEIRAMATPGHTPGGMCYLVSDRRAGAAGKNQEILISGDTLFAQSVGRTDLPGGDWDFLEDSLLKLARLPDDLPVLPGHGPATTIGTERKDNPFWPR